jgi:hypothetical protein
VASTNNVKDRVFFTAKNFTLQEAAIVLGGNADEKPVYFGMLSNYITDNVGAKSVAYKTLYDEKMPVFYALKDNLNNCIVHRINGFSDFVHHPDSKELEDKSRRWTKSENLLILCVIHHHQNPIESN